MEFIKVSVIARIVSLVADTAADARVSPRPRQNLLAVATASPAGHVAIGPAVAVSRPGRNRKGRLVDRQMALLKRLRRRRLDGPTFALPPTLVSRPAAAVSSPVDILTNAQGGHTTTSTYSAYDFAFVAAYSPLELKASPD